MSNPSSWYLPLAIAGVRIDRLRGQLSVAPSWPSAWGDALDMPVYLPDIQVRVNAGRTAPSATVSLVVERITSEPIEFGRVSVRLPADVSPSRVRAEVQGRGVVGVTAEEGGWFRLDVPVVLAAVGDGFTIMET